MVEYIVVGSGPAGIATIGALLNKQLERNQILWIDPFFTNGNLNNYKSIPANTKNKLLTRFLYSSTYFYYSDIKNRIIEYNPPEKTPLMADLLHDLHYVTLNLMKQVTCYHDYVDKINYNTNTMQWDIVTHSNTFISNNVILATGAIPKTLDLKCTSISDQYILNQPIDIPSIIDSSFCVIGNSHTAILVLKKLYDVDIKNIKCLYRSPIIHAVDMGDWIQNCNTGLKGIASEFAKTLPSTHIKMVKVNNIEEIQDEINDYDYVVQCIGYTNHNSVNLYKDGICHTYDGYNTNTGVINGFENCNLWGVGIGFPEQVVTRDNTREFNIGLDVWMNYIKRILDIEK
tara:strand:+ start:38 stop:1069 length:1032 start_codon:yes stop_codon:yes gene_type:complete